MLLGRGWNGDRERWDRSNAQLVVHLVLVAHQHILRRRDKVATAQATVVVAVVVVRGCSGVKGNRPQINIRIGILRDDLVDGCGHRARTVHKREILVQWVLLLLLLVIQLSTHTRRQHQTIDSNGDIATGGLPYAHTTALALTRVKGLVGELEDLVGVDGWLVVRAQMAQVGEGLPQERVQMERVPVRLARQLLALRLGADAGEQLQREAGDLAEVARHPVQGFRLERVVEGERHLGSVVPGRTGGDGGDELKGFGRIN